MNKFYSLTCLALLGLLGSQGLNAQDQNESIINKAPEGTILLYSRDSEGFYYDWGNRTYGTREGGISIIDGTDGFTYIHNPITGWATNTYIKGIREGNQVKVTLPQRIYQDRDVENNKMIYFNAAILDNVSGNAGTFDYRVSEQTELVYNIAEDGSLSFDFGNDEDTQYPSKVLGMISTEGIFYVGDVSQVLTPVDYDSAAPPEGLQTENWEIFDSATADNHTVNIGFEGNDVFLYNFDNIYAPRTWIKGTIDGDVISFPTEQFLGEFNGYFYWYLASNFYETQDSFSFEPIASVDFTIDREKMIMRAPEHSSMVANPRKSEIGLDYPEFMWYEDPVIKMMTEIPSSYIPQNPTFIAFVDYYQYLGYNYCEFRVNPLSVDYDLLNTEDIYFHIYLNGVAEEFFQSEGDFDFPFSYFGENPGSMIVQSFGGNVGMFLFMDGLDTIGIETVYYAPNDEIYTTDIITYNIETGEVTSGDPEGVESLYTGDVVATEYFDISGHKLQQPQKGLVIQRQRYSDGRIKSRKLMLR